MVTVKREDANEAGASFTLPIRAHEHKDAEQMDAPREAPLPALRLPQLPSVHHPLDFPAMLPHRLSPMSQPWSKFERSPEIAVGLCSGGPHTHTPSTGIMGDGWGGAGPTCAQRMAEHEAHVKTAHSPRKVSSEGDQYTRDNILNSGLPKLPTLGLSAGRTDATGFPHGFLDKQGMPIGHLSPAMYQSVVSQQIAQQQAMQQAQLCQQLQQNRQAQLYQQRGKEMMGAASLDKGLCGSNVSDTSDFSMRQYNLKLDQPKACEGHQSHAKNIENGPRGMNMGFQSWNDMVVSRNTDAKEKEFITTQKEHLPLSQQNRHFTNNNGEFSKPPMSVSQARPDYQVKLEALTQQHKAKFSLADHKGIPFVMPKDRPDYEYQGQLAQVDEMTKLARDQSSNTSIEAGSLKCGKQLELDNLIEGNQKRDASQQKNQANSSQDLNPLPAVPLSTQGTPVLQDYHRQLAIIDQRNKQRLLRSRGNPALQDYHIQLALLEQQNAKRLSKAKTEQEVREGRLPSPAKDEHHENSLPSQKQAVNSSPSPSFLNSNSSLENNHSNAGTSADFQDYYMQLEFLEQNKRRDLLAKAKQRISESAMSAHRVHGLPPQNGPVVSCPDHRYPGSPFGNSLGGIPDPPRDLPLKEFQDFPMQMLILEQHNKRRIMTAKTEHNEMENKLASKTMGVHPADDPNQRTLHQSRGDSCVDLSTEALQREYINTHNFDVPRGERFTFSSQPQRSVADQKNDFLQPVHESKQSASPHLIEQEKQMRESLQARLAGLEQQNNKRVMMLKMGGCEPKQVPQGARKQSVVEEEEFKLTPEEKSHILQRRRQQSEEGGRVNGVLRNPGKMALDDYEWQLRALEQRNKVQDRIGDERDLSARSKENPRGYGTVDD